MTSKTLERRSTADAEFVTVISQELPLSRVQFESTLKLVLEEFVAGSKLTEVDYRPFLDVAFIQDAAVAEGPVGVSFNGVQELCCNARNYFIPPYRPSFANIPAFGMWADREESDEELLRQLGGQWGGGELE